MNNIDFDEEHYLLTQKIDRLIENRKEVKNMNGKKSPYEADDIEKYKYLNPIWEKLNNIPDNPGITPDELFKDLGLDEEKANALLRELSNEFIQKFLKRKLSPVQHIFLIV